MSHAATQPLHLIDEAYRHGHQFIFLSGRLLDDLWADDTGQILPLRQSLVQHFYRTHQMCTLEFSLAYGSRFNLEALTREEAQAAERSLRESAPALMGAIAGTTRSDTAFPLDRAYRFFSALSATFRSAGSTVPVAFLCEFAEDLAPVPEAGAQTESGLQVSESLQGLPCHFQARRHPMIFILTGQPERVNPRVVQMFHRLDLPQPDVGEKRAFLGALQRSEMHAGATLEAGLDAAVVSHLTARTPNRGLEQAILASARSRRPVTSAALTELKRRDVLSLSEGTLTMLDLARVRGIHLAGRSVARPMAILMEWARQLRSGNRFTPMNVLLAGAPSTAKTDLALLTALHSEVPAYRLNSPKASLVGQTERLARRMFTMFKDFSPCLGVIDEITDAMPMERTQVNLDSGASSAVTAEMLTALSDSSRAGLSLLIATTNCLWRVGAAMASRFLFVPVLMPLAEDYPAILISLCRSLTEGAGVEMPLHAGDAAVQEAALQFHRKGISPRAMRGLLSSKLALNRGQLNQDLLMRAARHAGEQSPADRASAEYADLYAVSACSDSELLPWHGVENYPVPAYLKDILSPSGELDRTALGRRLQELQPLVNL